MKMSRKHNHEEKQNVINRLSRAIVHLEAVKKMVIEDRDCSDVLIQIAAVRSSIQQIGNIILKDHINTCVVDAIETSDQKILEEFSAAIDQFLK